MLIRTWLAVKISDKIIPLWCCFVMLDGGKYEIFVEIQQYNGMIFTQTTVIPLHHNSLPPPLPITLITFPFDDRICLRSYILWRTCPVSAYLPKAVPDSTVFQNARPVRTEHYWDQWGSISVQANGAGWNSWIYPYKLAWLLLSLSLPLSHRSDLCSNQYSPNHFSRYVQISWRWFEWRNGV